MQLLTLEIFSCKHFFLLENTVCIKSKTLDCFDFYISILLKSKVLFLISLSKKNFRKIQTVIVQFFYIKNLLVLKRLFLNGNISQRKLSPA